MEKRINVHSFIDVITNSSTESYVRSNKKSIEFMHEFINEILKQSGSDRKSEDLFEFTIVPTEDAIQNALYGIADDLQTVGMTYSEAIELAKKKVDSGEIDPKDYLKESSLYDNALLMKSKKNDHFTLDISERFLNMFDIGEREN